MNEYLTDDQLAETVTAALNAEADAAFPDDRLARQRSRILQRIEQDGRPGRLITFPAGQARTAGSLLHATSTTRWVAAAAVVAFIAGLVAGQRLPSEFHFGSPVQRLAVSRPAPEPTGTTLRASSPLMPSDDEFLGEIEMAAQSRPAVLRHLDELTPRAWDVEAVGQ
jgi:hypothetical protein